MTQNLPSTPPSQAAEAAEMRALARQLYRLALQFDRRGDAVHAGEARQVARDARRLAREPEGKSDAK